MNVINHMDHLVWPADTFRYTLGQEPTGGRPDIDLVGRGRIVVHGPYARLSPGAWRITFRFEIDTEGDPIHLRFDWGVGSDTASLSQEFSDSGLYELEMEHAWKAVGPVELRVWLNRSSLHGRMRMLEALVERLPPAPQARS